MSDGPAGRLTGWRHCAGESRWGVHRRGLEVTSCRASRGRNQTGTDDMLHL